MEMVIDFKDLIKDGLTNVISGRKLGEQFAKDTKIVERLRVGVNYTIIIDAEKIKAINDSFLKGFYGEIYKELKSKDIINLRVKLDTDKYYKSLIDKCLIVIESINKIQ